MKLYFESLRSLKAMKLEPFFLERYFAKHEFSAKYLLASSDCEAFYMEELLESADAQSLRLWESLKLGYTDSSGHPVLRESIADMYKSVSADDILVLTPEEGIFLAMQALLRPGDHVICTFPGYQSLYELARSMGCDVSLWKPDEDRGWHFSLRQLQNLIRDDTKMVVVNFPHNPTGYLPSHDGYMSLVDIVRRSGAYLFSDEMYRLLEFDREATLPAGCEVYRKAISLSGLSKSFGLPGLRIGWVATRDHNILEQMRLLKDYTTICSSAPSEILGIMAVRDRENIIARQMTRIRKNISILGDFFSKYSNSMCCNPPLAGSICFPRMSLTDDTSVFCETLIKETGIMLVPSNVFQYGNHHVRIGFGREDFPEIIERFSTFVDSCQRNQS
ncbi:MAG: aminotransferase class I/II-fold pyridoxal phosphate-dependent enzyme [Desulfobacterales bacterium]